MPYLHMCAVCFVLIQCVTSWFSNHFFLILIPLIPPPFYQNENHHLKSQLGLLGHELNDRDMSIDQMRAALIRSRDDVLKNSLPDEKLFLSNRKFLVSISTILQDLNKNTKIDGAASGDTNQNQLYKNENLQERAPQNNSF